MFVNEELVCEKCNKVSDASKVCEACMSVICEKHTLRLKYKNSIIIMCRACHGQLESREEVLEAAATLYTLPAYDENGDQLPVECIGKVDIDLDIVDKEISLGEDEYLDDLYAQDEEDFDKELEDEDDASAS